MEGAPPAGSTSPSSASASEGTSPASAGGADEGHVSAHRLGTAPGRSNRRSRARRTSPGNRERPTQTEGLRRETMTRVCVGAKRTVDARGGWQKGRGVRARGGRHTKWRASHRERGVGEGPVGVGQAVRVGRQHNRTRQPRVPQPRKPIPSGRDHGDSRGDRPRGRAQNGAAAEDNVRCRDGAHGPVASHRPSLHLGKDRRRPREQGKGPREERGGHARESTHQGALGADDPERRQADGRGEQGGGLALHR